LIRKKYSSVRRRQKKDDKATKKKENPFFSLDSHQENWLERRGDKTLYEQNGDIVQKIIHNIVRKKQSYEQVLNKSSIEEFSLIFSSV
jgi:hypothetical protein